MLLVVIASVMSGVIRGDIAGMVRLVCVRLPVAIFVTYIAIWLVTQLLALTNLATSMGGGRRHARPRDVVAGPRDRQTSAPTS